MDAGLLEIFREESLERVARMAATLLDAEADGGDAGTIAQLFRETHSIKGSAGMFGLDDIGGLAGAMEDVLAGSRERGVLSPRAIPALLGAADALRDAVNDDPGGVGPAATALRALDGGEREDPPAVTVAPARMPGQIQRTLRVRAEKVDRLLAGVGEAALYRRRLERLAASEAPTSEALREEVERGRALVDDLLAGVLELRTLPLDTIIGGLTRAVRDAAAEVNRDVELELEGTLIRLDRVILDGISDALIHLLRNAVFHGIESPAERELLGKPRTGTVRITAEQQGGLVALTCADDGRGVAAELLARVPADGSLADLLAQPGFSTAGDVSQLAGRGVGLDAVKLHIEALGGVLEISSEPGAGTTATMLVPLTLAVITVLLFERGEHVFGVPLSGVRRTLRGTRGLLLADGRHLELDGVPMPLFDPSAGPVDDACGPVANDPLVVIASGPRRAALLCDRLLDDREVVVTSLGPLLSALSGYLGAAILDDGRVALLLDPAQIARAAEAPAIGEERAEDSAPRRTRRVLVVDDDKTVRELARTTFEAAGYRVSTAADGDAALAALAEEDAVDCVVSDIEMPGMNGLDLLERIRAQHARSTLPVVMVTSRDDEEALLRGADAGADAWLVKSRFAQSTLLDTVGRLIGSP